MQNEFDTEFLHFLKFIASLDMDKETREIVEKKTNHVWAEYEKYKSQTHVIVRY